MIPQSILAIRVSACVAVAITATALYFIVRVIDRGALAGAAAAILYLGWTARWWGQAANTELYLDALIAVAMYLLVQKVAAPVGRGRRVGRMYLAALLLGVALHVKHVALAETALFFGVLCFGIGQGIGRVTRAEFATAVATFCVPTVIVVAYFSSAGLGREYFEAMVGSNLAYVVDRTSFAVIWPGLPKSFALPIAITLVAAALLVRRPSPAVILLILWEIAAIIDVALPGKFWDHYFLLLMPAGAALGGYLAARASEAWPRLAVLVLPAALVLGNPIGVVGDAFKARVFADRDVPRMIADRITPEIAPDDSIFVFNYQPVLYFLTETKLPTRYVQPDAWSRHFSPVSGAIPLQEIDAVFATQPKFVVFMEADWLNMGDDAFAALRAHLGAYEKAFEVEDRQLLPEPVPVQVYRRKDARAESDPRG